MIKKIDILKFGLYSNYKWDETIGRDIFFRRLNIIYGRNYSGKTTLSRIFKCVEDKVIHKDFSDASFALECTDSSVITHSDFDTDYKFMVYNSDFVKDNLSWLHSEDGTILPFTILGAENNDIQNKISEIEKQLGSIDEQYGLKYSLHQLEQEVKSSLKYYDDRKKQLDEKLRKFANDTIKVNTSLFKPSSHQKTYIINNLKSEIDIVEKGNENFILDEDEQDRLKILLREDPKNNLQLLKVAKPNFLKYFKETEGLVSMKITPNKPITDLINDSLLQEWVRQGIDKHKGKKKACGFCGGDLDPELWQKLDAHFNKESEELRKQLSYQIDKLEIAKTMLMSFLKIDKSNFYVSLAVEFDEVYKRWIEVIEFYNSNLEKLISSLKQRETNIFKEFHINQIGDVSDEIKQCLESFNEIINKHNLITGSLEDSQNQTIKRLRFSVIGKFIKDISYRTEQEFIEKLKKEYDSKNEKYIEVKEQKEKLEQDRQKLEHDAKDESKGAKLVNDYLSHFFGHKEITLEAEGVTPYMRFIVYRNGVHAKNLSEGECSLISFCYFIAKIRDNINDKSIIYIDDPISSLDSNHIFFVFSLIETEIAKPKKYGQLFISTHNLEFLKYLKKIFTPKYKVDANITNKEKPDINNFIIDRRNKNFTLLKLAPAYLRYYITEFNYLFSQIYNCSEVSAETVSFEYQYNFANNMRKFLEAYLFYRYPDHTLNGDQRIRKFFENDEVTVALINRVINEYSHLGEQFDRGMLPIDIDEIIDISKRVINKMRDVDPDQYQALKDSVKKD